MAARSDPSSASMWRWPKMFLTCIGRDMDGSKPDCYHKTKKFWPSSSWGISMYWTPQIITNGMCFVCITLVNVFCILLLPNERHVHRLVLTTLLKIISPWGPLGSSSQSRLKIYRLRGRQAHGLFVTQCLLACNHVFAPAAPSCLSMATGKVSWRLQPKT